MLLREFNAQDQLKFAQLSGDYNPLHLDSKAARRLLFGGTVVHGIHTLLWAVDSWLETKREPVQLECLEARFLRPVKVDEQASIRLLEEIENRVKVFVLVDSIVASEICFTWHSGEQYDNGKVHNDVPEQSACRHLTAQQAEHLSGQVALFYDPDLVNVLFKNIDRLMSSLQIAQLLASTRIVGMQCPGLHSTYSSLTLHFSKNTILSEAMKYRVVKSNARFGHITIDIHSINLSGQIVALFRSPPQRQPGYADVKKHLCGNEFRTQKAVIIGGSRGIGETTAKLLAAGGAEVRLSYFQGREEAESVVDEMLKEGAIAECFFFDVTDPDSNLSDNLGAHWQPTHLYYFSTPFIFAGNKGLFSQKHFSEFCRHYVAGFHQAVSSLYQQGMHTVYYPSTVYLDDSPTNMAEYVAAKAAGEAIGSFLENLYPKLTVYSPRLPKVATDQTASFIQNDCNEPLEVILQTLRVMNATG